MTENSASNGILANTNMEAPSSALSPHQQGSNDEAYTSAENIVPTTGTGGSPIGTNSESHGKLGTTDDDLAAEDDSKDQDQRPLQPSQAPASQAGLHQQGTSGRSNIPHHPHNSFTMDSTVDSEC